MPRTPSSTVKRLRKSTRSHPAAAPAWTLDTSRNGVTVLQSSLLHQFKWLVHGFSTSPGGVSSLNDQKVLNLGFTEWDSRANVERNRQLLHTAMNAGDFTFVPLKQFHSDVVCEFAAAPAQPCNGDASITNTPGLLLGIQRLTAFQCYL